MTRALIVHAAGPGTTVQDMGRPGYLSQGVPRGGAADRLALFEAAALLGQPESHAALELPGTGGTFEATEDMRIALTGAPMRATLEGARLAWNACHALPAGARLTIGATEAGIYGYLTPGGGLATPERLGARATYLAAGLGAVVAAGERLPVGEDPQPGRTGLCLPAEPRFEGGTIRIVPSLQTPLFTDRALARFAATAFRRDARGNRMGVPLLHDHAEGFHAEGGLSVLSEVIVPGDIQVTGDGTPFVLLADCQTTGGYPRIATVIPADLPRVAQAGPGASLRFRFVTLEEALAAERAEAARRAALPRGVRPLVRSPHDIPDLLAYQLVGGVTAGDDMERNRP
ncbi:MAG: biotin-dependent carboxyltransferase family protein [Paracoccaceae bacterium]